MSFSPIARALILDREGGECFRCRLKVVWWPDDRPQALAPYSIHHRRPRGMGGSTDDLTDHPSNGILVCGTGTTGCHGWIEAHRSAALADGYLVRQGVDPSTVPVRLPMSAELVYLGTDGYVYRKTLVP